MNPKWKQKTPADQLVALMSSLEGILCNFEEDVIQKKEFLKQSSVVFNQIKELQPYLSSEKIWINS